MRGWLVIVMLAACKRVVSTAGPPTAEQITEACAKYVACDPMNQSVSGCLADTRYPYGTISAFRPDQIRCIADTGADCEEILACVGLTRSTCTTPGVRCDADHQIECLFGGIEYTVDCSGGLYHSEDETCVIDRCGLRTCDQPGTDECNGTWIERCEFGGVVTGYDCAAFGEICRNEGEFARCVPRVLVPCDVTRCEGDVLIECDGFEHRLDCASLFASGDCLSRSGQCAIGDECSPGMPAACAGNVLVACALGKLVELDCTQLGFAGCSIDRCVP